MTLQQKQAMSLLIISTLNDMKKKRRKNRVVWTKPWLQQKDKFSDMRLLKHLKENNPDDYRNYLRMDDMTFGYLLEKVRPTIERNDTKLRPAITAEQRLAVTLRYLATGRTLQDLKFSSIISPQALGQIIPDTCKAIYDVLRNEYLKFPTCEEDWKHIAAGFYEQWNFPNCGGAIDGKHVGIVKPANSGSYFYNYKGYFSVVLLAIVNANLEFIYIDVGQNGRVSDGGVIENSTFYDKLCANALNIPSKDNTVAGLNFVFIGDEAFSLKEDFFKPFPQKRLTYDQRLYNYRLCRARRVVENAFGVLASKFRIFHTTITLSPDKVEYIVLSSVVLHNILRNKLGKNYLSPTLIDQEDCASSTVIPGAWRNTPTPSDAFQSLKTSMKSHASCQAIQSRDSYVKYFTTVGQVPWQDRMITEGPH